MTDLEITMPNDNSVKTEGVTNDDKRMIDNLKYLQTAEPLKEIITEEEELAELPIPAQEIDVKPIIDDKVVFSSNKEVVAPADEVLEDEPPSPIKKVKTPSLKQRDHLKKAREKALETRKAKAAERKLVEEEKRLERQRKRDEKEKLMIAKEEKELSVPVNKEPLTKRPHSYMSEFTQEQLVELQQKAIENYEIKRKSAKKLKKEQQVKDTADKKIYETIQKAVGPTTDAWDDCFR